MLLKVDNKKKKTIVLPQSGEGENGAARIS